LTGSWAAAADSQGVEATPAAGTLAPKAMEYLKSRDLERAVVWVFFADKGVKSSAEFSAAAEQVRLTERSRNRRIRTGVASVTIADLPVVPAYIQRVEALGGKVRRQSRWLNAASFELPYGSLETVGQLPFVVRVTPVAGFARAESDPVDTRKPPSQESAAGGLSYGPSISQNLQINAAAAHLQGYSGRGVTLAITDSGFRKTHEAFASAFAEGRILAEYDFINNDNNTDTDENDPVNQISHGTMVWSTAAGYSSGKIIGPGYGANFILCKTEDLQSETPIEEDNWVAALEFADSVGADVINTSLGYSNWYTYADMDGQTAITSIAASTCNSLGIVLCVAMGNGGPGSGTLNAPADAFDMLSIGGVDLTGTITGFSSRGPTYDGRMKPDVCALSMDTYCAYWSADDRYVYGIGTSFATPLIAGAVCLLIEARPELSPTQIREALRGTASRAANPDNNYGWGIADVGKALRWPVDFSADQVAGELPLTVQFNNDSWLEASAVVWDFGDGFGSTVFDPVHLYDHPGIFDIGLTIQTDEGEFSRAVERMIAVHADSLWIETRTVNPGQLARIDVYARNYLPITNLEIPFQWAGDLDLSYETFSTAGLRTQLFPSQNRVSFDSRNKRATISLNTTSAAVVPELTPGTGPVLSLYFRVPADAPAGYNPITLTAYGSYNPEFVSGGYSYGPTTTDGAFVIDCCEGIVGNANGSEFDTPTIGDVMRLLDHLYISQQPLECYAEADIDQSGGAYPTAEDITIADVAMLVDYLFSFRTTTELPICP
jgi:subtilisin family serine protease